MGMMSPSDIEIEERFKVGMDQLIIVIQAGQKGWTILYNDGSTEYEDIVNTTKNNFDKAMRELQKHFSDINKI